VLLLKLALLSNNLEMRESGKIKQAKQTKAKKL
jgi:hypothetical protein